MEVSAECDSTCTGVGSVTMSNVNFWLDLVTPIQAIALKNAILNKDEDTRAD